MSKIFKANGTGVDYPNEFTELAQKKGLEILFGRIEDIDFKKKFDLIVLSHVLEHITNPKALIYSLKKLLSTKGILIIEVPSVDNLLNGKYSFDLLKYFQNMHIHHFTINSLRYLAQELSLEIIYIDDVSRVVMKNKLKKDDLQHFNNFEKSYSLLQSIEELRIKKNKYKIFRAPIVTLKSIIRFIK